MVFREFLILSKKILIILIISFVQIGDGSISYQNNGFLILILNLIFLGLELKFQPFATPELNSLSWISNLMMIITIFGGLFSSINQESVIVPLIIMVLLMVLNIYFILVFFQNYIQIQLCFQTKTNKLTEIFGRFWLSGKKLSSSLKICKF